MGRVCQYMTEGSPCGARAARFVIHEFPGGGEAEILLCYEHDAAIKEPQEIELGPGDADSEE